MPPPKYIEGPNTVQTSLYGYDRNKKVQLNNLRGKPIVVMRSDSVNATTDGPPRSPKKWVDRSNQMPLPIASKPLYPSYAHFHHQYSCPKTSPTQSTPTPTASSTRNGSIAHRHSPTSPKITPEDEMSVKRVFEKLAVSTPPPTCSPNSSFSNVSSEITLLELTPKIAMKTFTTTMICDASATETETESVDPSFMIDSPKSLSDSRRTSCSDISVEQNAEDDVSLCELVVKPEGPKPHTCDDQTQCIMFRGGKCNDEENERKMALQWYDDLIQWRHDIVTKKRIGPPRCHPPPLTVTIVGASRAQRANPFHRVGEVHPFAMEAMDHVRRRMDARRSHRLIPADLPLPPPHEFIANAKCMEPHLFVEYCYQLTAAAYIDTGLNPPNRRPPIPPRIEPIPESLGRESICSSASEISSDGEYSDDSDGTKKERLRQKIERHTRRERRLQQLFRRRQVLDEIDEEDF